jgi:acrylyl-CoA reductase (NADPH)
MAETARAYVLDLIDGKVQGSLREIDTDHLPEGDVRVRVSHSGLNYKDGLVLTGAGGLVKKYPHVPGIDFAGEVESSASPAFKSGDKVVLTGWRVGENRWGGYATHARVRADWLVKLPAHLTPAAAMALGTAGFTAMMCVDALERHGLKPNAGEVLVTGAAGGVGSVATLLLSSLGYQVVASTGRAELGDYLRQLGAERVLDRAEFAAPAVRPLATERWSGCVDTVAGTTLPNVLSQLKYRASVASCGLAGGNELHTTVIPFLLRGVNLLGIDSVQLPVLERIPLWERLSRTIDLQRLNALTTTIGLSAVGPSLGSAILAGRVKGRTVIEVDR